MTKCTDTMEMNVFIKIMSSDIIKFPTMSVNTRKVHRLESGPRADQEFET